MKKNFFLIAALLLAAVIYYGCDKKDDTPEPELPTPPAADFTFIVSNHQTRTVDFTNTSVYANSYSWNFGDAVTSTVTSPQHSFPSYGSYSVALTAHGQGGSNTATKTVTITP